MSDLDIVGEGVFTEQNTLLVPGARATYGNPSMGKPVINDDASVFEILYTFTNNSKLLFTPIKILRSDYSSGDHQVRYNMQIDGLPPIPVILFAKQHAMWRRDVRLGGGTLQYLDTKTIFPMKIVRYVPLFKDSTNWFGNKKVIQTDRNVPVLKIGRTTGRIHLSNTNAERSKPIFETDFEIFYDDGYTTKPESSGGRMRSHKGSRWVSAGRKVTLRDGKVRTLYRNPAKPGDLRVRRMVKRRGANAATATYVKFRSQ